MDTENFRLGTAGQEPRVHFSILVSGSSPLFRSVLCSYLMSRTWGTVSSVATMVDAKKMTQRQHFDIVLVASGDVDDDLLHEVKEACALPDFPRIVVLSKSAGEGVAMRCIEAGAIGYIPEDIKLHSLFPALELVHAGEIFVPRRIQKPRERAEPQSWNMPELSDIDLTLLRMIEAGAQNKAIAGKLGKSETSVKAMVRKTFIKLKARNRPHAVHIAQANGLI